MTSPTTTSTYRSRLSGNRTYGLATRASCAAFAVTALVVAAPRLARANGRFPASVNVMGRAGEPDDVYVALTFGLLISHDDGRTYAWTCEQNVGYGGVYDPHYEIAADGTIYATTLDGLRVSRDGGCSFTTVTEEIVVDGLDLDSAGLVWIATGEAGITNAVHRSTDQGRTFERQTLESATLWWNSLRVAPSDADRVYVSGYVTGETPTIEIHRTIDGGESWESLPIDNLVPGTGGSVELAAVDPASADVVYAFATGVNDPGDRLFRSADGGLNWTAVLDTAAPIEDVVIRSSGEVLVATVTDGLYRSSTGGTSFTRMATAPQLGCLGERGDGVLFGCGDNWDPDYFTIARSEDAIAWTGDLRFHEMAGPLSCPAGTVQYDVCELQMWPSIREQFVVTGPFDAGPADGEGDERGGGCCDTGGGATSSASWALVVLVAFVGRRRRVFGVGALVLAGIIGTSGSAHANGRFPQAIDVRLHPTDDEVLGFQVTFGFLISQDGGDHWYWLCEEAVGFAGVYDPDYAFTPSGLLIATTTSAFGLRLTRDLCTWNQAPPALNNTFTSQVEVSPDGTIFVAASDPADSQIYVSTDDGASFTVRSNPGLAGDWWETLTIAPSNPQVIYLAGFRFVDSVKERFLLRSDDAGVTWAPRPITDFQFGGNGADLQIVSIAPSDPELLYARVFHASGLTIGDDIYRSSDGGMTWTRVFQSKDDITAVVFRGDGTVVLATRSSGLHTSTDGVAFGPAIGTLQAHCLRERDGTLFICSNGHQPDYMALGTSTTTDGFTPVFSFEEITGPWSCGAGTTQAEVCEAQRWCGLACQLGVNDQPQCQCLLPIDAAPVAGDNDREPPKGCCGAGERSSGAPALLVVVSLALRARRRTARVAVPDRTASA